MVLAGLEAALPPESPRATVCLSGRKVSPDAQGANEALASLGDQTAEAESDLHTEPHPIGAMSFKLLGDPSPALNSLGAGESDPTGTIQPLPANLIQFPREIVATRRLRARRAEGPLAALDSTPQLSIFEVDPAAISTQPAPAVAEEPAAPDWMRPGWLSADSGPNENEERVAAPSPQEIAASLAGLAPVGSRLLALVVDCSLTLAGFLAVLALAVSSGILVRNPRAFELGSALVLLLVGAGYQAIFTTAAKATPGMWYAGIGLSTLDGYEATREQRLMRLSALPLSILPLGIGLAWSLFDEDHLTWHDRLSGTYPRLR